MSASIEPEASAAGLKQRLDEDIKASMRARNRDRLSTLRLIMAAIKQKEVDERIAIDDAQVLAILDKIARRHRDSIAQYQEAGRDDLAAKERAELGIVLEFLPKPLAEDEIARLLDEAVAATAATGMADMGKVMGALRPRLQGRADMGKVSALVKKRLAQN